jgi:hypothetical protein
MANADPYRTMPERSAAPGGFRLAAAVFLGWLVVASLLGGASFAACTAYALAPFGGAAYAASITALALLRVLAAPVAASAAGIAVVVSTHGSSTRELRRVWPPWCVYAAVPVAMPVAALLMMGAGVLVLRTYDVAPAVSWRVAAEHVMPADAFFGVRCAALDAVVLGGLATVAVRRFEGVRASRTAKAAVALAVTVLITAAIGACAGAFVT